MAVISGGVAYGLTALARVSHPTSSPSATYMKLQTRK
jgi:hypothetical protein